MQVIALQITIAQTKNDSLALIFQDEKRVDSLRFKALDNYYEINNQTQPDLALDALEYHYNLAKQKNATRQLFFAAKRKGNIYRLKSDYDKATEAYEDAERLSIQLNDGLLQAGIIGNIGNIYVYRQDYKRATQSFSKALEVFRKENDTDRESHMLTSLGSVYLIINNYDLALDYYQKAMDILNKRGFEDRSTAIIYINIGWTNFEKGRYSVAENDYLKGLKIFQQKNENFFIANCYETLAKIYLKLNQLEKSEIYAAKNLALNKELGVRNGILDAEIIIAQLTFETDIVDATKKAEAILANLPVDANNRVKRTIYQLLYKCYKAQNKLGLSLKMHEKFTVYNDSLQLEKNNFAVAREAVKNEFEDKLYQTQLENEKEQAKIELKQLKRTFSIIAVAVLLIILTILYFRNKSKNNRKKRDALLKEIKNLKNKTSTNIIVDSEVYELIREKIETSINRTLNETDWSVLNILLQQPEITNKEIAEKAFMSVDGIGSSLRRMYQYFDIENVKYKKIALITDAIKRSNS